ncbi:hypothetical protein H2198_004301 [Neophaeococcomyces mojaviensis]|uniref:Uncharacterized protein n=1 Tax=Neophaeococcomyces mojaviensis TaxID=3383035 RepID=A0ACC3A8W0_9EURO|nr:hypothetical protein H2198_004301 [Knufia sp. JES_112]
MGSKTSSTTIPIWNSNFFHSSGLLQGDWPDCLPLIPLLVTFIISLCFLVKLVLKRSKNGNTSSEDYLKSRSRRSAPITTSKLHVYLSLTTLILLLAFLILAGISGVYRSWRPAVITSSAFVHPGNSSKPTLSTLSFRHILNPVRRSISDSNPLAPTLTPPTTTPQPSSSNTSNQSVRACTLANVFTRRCNPTLYLIGDLQIAAVATGSLVWLLNLVLFTLQLREHQYQKRKLQRSLRAKAKAKLDIIIEEDELSRSEKGVSTKKIHHTRRTKSHAKSSSESSLTSTIPSTNGPQHLTRPTRAATTTLPRPNMSGTGTGNTAPLVRPKQHHYNPTISPSRRQAEADTDKKSSSSTLDEYTQLYSNNHQPAFTTAPLQTPYAKAVEEARKKVKPAETMRDWMAGRYA